mmetsp:Transcript_26097/g.71898  ORF Transcript_26097/g.71898 Transcript_26097/m.71898 type:complete len:122 (-) Transcript_26097:397-762(-)
MRLPVPTAAPRTFLRLMARCWAEEPVRRPEFDKVVEELSDIHDLAAAAAAAEQLLPPRRTVGGGGRGEGAIVTAATNEGADVDGKSSADATHLTLAQLSSGTGSGAPDILATTFSQPSSSQ